MDAPARSSTDISDDGTGIALPDTSFTDRHFGVGLISVVGLGAVIRFVYIFRDTRTLVGGDGFDYHFSALRLADGLGYTRVVGNAGAPAAHHPPGWVTVLGVASWMGARSIRAHQVVAVVIGLGLVAVVGLVGRRYFDARIGLIAGAIAAVYPGFWVLEGNLLSESLALLVLGLLLLVIAGLREHPTLARSIGTGALCGLLALVRSEQLALVVLVVAPVLLLSRTLSMLRRVLLVVAAVCACLIVIAPWAIYNSTRFKDPVLLSTSDGGLLLDGNCPPKTYSGPLLGWYDTTCLRALPTEHPGFDESQTDALARRDAKQNIVHNVSKLPVVVPARFGRLIALYHPSQTVGLVAAWMKTKSAPIWAWVVSYWLLLPLALAGVVIAWRRRAFVLPLLGPAIIVAVDVAMSYGEPRYHTMSDLGTIVFAAVTLDAMFFRKRKASGRSQEAVLVTTPNETVEVGG